MTDLRLSRSLSLPIDVAGEALGILATRGAGKSYTSAVLIEELYGAGVQVAVIDPTGVYWGLRGGDHGLPIIVAGGAHGDVPLEATAGPLIADLLVDTGQSLVLDLSDFPTKGAQTRFVTDFAERLYRRKARARSTLHLILDEADEFAPQKPMRDEARMLGALETLVRRGRSRGLGTTLITQRSAALNKNVLDLIETLIVLRTLGPRDRKAIADWISAKELRDDLGVLESLPSLPTGTAWIWAPMRAVLEKTAMRRIRTFDSYATPKPGEKRAEPRALAPVDLEKLGEQITATVERAKADDPKELRKQIRDLQAQAKKRPTETQTVEVEKVVEVPVFNGELEDLHRLIEECGRVSLDLKAAAAPLESAATAVMAGAEKVADAVNLVRGRETRRPDVPRPPARPRAAPTAPVTRVTPAGDGELGGGPRKILESLASRYPMRATRAQLGTLSGYSYKGGTFNKYFSILKRDGLLEESGGEVSVTEQGLDYFGGTPPAPQSPDEVRAMWLGVLEGGPRRLLEQLIAHHGSDITREELGALTGYEASGGTFNKYLSILRRNDLVLVDGGFVRASDDLFLEGE